MPYLARIRQSGEKFYDFIVVRASVHIFRVFYTDATNVGSRINACTLRILRGITSVSIRTRTYRYNIIQRAYNFPIKFGYTPCFPFAVVSYCTREYKRRTFHRFR